MEPYQQSLPHGYVLQGEKNRYIIDRVLGQGSFGITYLARYKAAIQGSIGKGSVWVQVAVKEFFMRDMNTRDGSTGYLNDVSQDSLLGRYRRAFMREARNLAGLHHNNIVNVFEVVETNNTVYIVMEYINGGSLDEHIAQAGHLSQDESIDKMLQLCSAVECMHENRMLHLDIKPKNVMLDEDGNLFLIDFGLSKQFNADGEPESSTTIGLGTPGYAPLEQVEHQDGGKKFPATIDIYALGATMYKMLTGKTPPNASQVSGSVIDGNDIIANKLQDAGISVNLAAVVTKSMWPSSRGRYQTVRDLESALNDVQTPMAVVAVEEEQTIVAHAAIVTPASETESVPQPEYNEETASLFNQDFKTEPKAEPHPQPNREPKESRLRTKPESKVQPKQVNAKEIRNDRSSKTGFPKWLYAVIAVLVVGVTVFLVMPKPQPSPAPISNPEPSKPLKEEVTTPTLIAEPEPTTKPNIEPNPEPTPEPVPEPKSEPQPESKLEPKPEYRIVALSSISLNKSSLTLEEGATSNLTVRYVPSDATDKSTTWKSTDTEVATVSSSGLVTALKAGGATVIVTSSDKEARCDIVVNARQTTGTNNGHDWVDLGLSVKWATCNIGAYAPEAYGDYYAWGETGVKNDYSLSTYKYCNGSYDTQTKYCNNSNYGYNGYTDGLTKLEMNDDVARVKWGGNWRMPTYDEFQELIDNCNLVWTNLNGTNGYKITSKKSGYSDCSIFMPAAGYRDGLNPFRVDSFGYYWSKSLFRGDPNYAYIVRFYSGGMDCGRNYREYGSSVRPVCP